MGAHNGWVEARCIRSGAQLAAGARDRAWIPQPLADVRQAAATQEPQQQRCGRSMCGGADGAVLRPRASRQSERSPRGGASVVRSAPGAVSRDHAIVL